MKIAIDCRIIESAEFFGPQRATVEMLRELFLQDDLNEFILFFKDIETKDAVMKEFDGIAGSCTCVIVPFGMRGIKNLLYMPGVIRRYSPDVYYLPFYFMNPLIPKKCRVVITIYDLIPYLYPNEKMSLLNRLFHRVWIANYLVFSRADAVITCSIHTSQDLVKRFRVNPEKIHMIYLGATHSVAPVDVSVAKENVIQWFGLNKSYMLYVGRNEPHKNIKGMIDAYRLLPQFIRDQYLLVIGGKQDEKFASQLSAYVDSYGLGNHVRFIGYVRQDYLSSLYSSAELLLLVSHYEGFGIPILEAFMCRVPVISSNASCLPEVAGDAALYADSRDVKKISLHMHTLLGNNLLRAELIQKGVEQLSRFSWRLAAKQLSEVLRGGSDENRD